jgi:hypothetical protein
MYISGGSRGNIRKLWAISLVGFPQSPYPLRLFCTKSVNVHKLSHINGQTNADSGFPSRIYSFFGVMRETGLGPGICYVQIQLGGQRTYTLPHPQQPPGGFCRCCPGLLQDSTSRTLLWRVYIFSAGILFSAWLWFFFWETFTAWFTWPNTYVQEQANLFLHHC